MQRCPRQTLVSIASHLDNEPVNVAGGLGHQLFSAAVAVALRCGVAYLVPVIDLK